MLFAKKVSSTARKIYTMVKVANIFVYTYCKLQLQAIVLLSPLTVTLQTLFQHSAGNKWAENMFKHNKKGFLIRLNYCRAYATPSLVSNFEHLSLTPSPPLSAIISLFQLRPPLSPFGRWLILWTIPKSLHHCCSLPSFLSVTNITLLQI